MADQLLLTEAPPLAASVPCNFCSSRIPADCFDYVYWSADERLLAARCPGYHQRTIMSFKLWRRTMGMSVAAGWQTPTTAGPLLSPPHESR